MARTTLIAAILIVAGCGSGEGPSRLEVEMLSVSGQVAGAEVPSTTNATVTGERQGNQGTFFVEGPSLSLQLSACPLGNLDVDPYGTGSGVGPGEPVPVPQNEPASGRTGVVSGVDCIGRGLTICGGQQCGQFTSDELDLQIVEENGWRLVTANADGASGTVGVSLRYREVR